MREDDTAPRSAVAPVPQGPDSSGRRPDSGLARDLSDMAREMQAEPELSGVLKRIVTTALFEVDAADHGGISIIEGAQVHTEAASDELVTRIDDLQYRLGEGPCLTVLRDQQTARSAELARDPRWPRFGPEAAELGVRSMLSVQLFVEDDNLGALNLYSDRVDAFDDDDESVAMLLASHAAVAMKGNRLTGNLRTALVSRDLIGQAKGILMERYKIGAAQAFDLLVLASQRTHRKVRDVAEHLAATGELQTS